LFSAKKRVRIVDIVDARWLLVGEVPACRPAVRNRSPADQGMKTIGKEAAKVLELSHTGINIFPF